MITPHTQDTRSHERNRNADLKICVEDSQAVVKESHKVNPIGRKLHVIKYAIVGELLKLRSHIIPTKLSEGLNDNARNRKVVVSLTSYGRRTNIVDTTIFSLLKQSYKPDRIILWLDDKNWNCENLPRRLKKLLKYGVEIRFCNDVKSYKKLVPTLPLVSDNDYIITVDDDQYYPKDFVKGLVEAMDKNPTSIYCYAGRRLVLDDNSKLLPYNEWKLTSKNIIGETFMAIGAYGIIYKKCLLHSDIYNEELFMKLAPMADDIWFFFMALMNGVKCTPIHLNQHIVDIDFIYQKFHTGSSLREMNRGENFNDKQIRDIMTHYHLNDEDIVSEPL